MICHLSALLGFVIMPSANIWAPLVLWLMKRNDSSYIDEQGRESVNFHLSLWLYALLTGALWFTIILIPLACVMWAVFYVMGIAYTIVASIAASNGRPYTYPWTIRFI